MVIFTSADSIMVYGIVKSGVKISLTIIIITAIITIIRLEFLEYVPGHLTILNTLSHPNPSSSKDKKTVPES